MRRLDGPFSPRPAFDGRRRSADETASHRSDVTSARRQIASCAACVGSAGDAHSATDVDEKYDWTAAFLYGSRRTVTRRIRYRGRFFFLRKMSVFTAGARLACTRAYRFHVNAANFPSSEATDTVTEITRRTIRLFYARVAGGRPSRVSTSHSCYSSSSRL